MLFLIQENLFREEHYNTLIETMQKYGFDYRIVSVKENIENIDGIDTKNVFCFGSIRMARLAKDMGWYPGSFMNENHDYEIYSKQYGLENMLNGDSLITNFSDSLDFSNGNLFIRPTKDTKVFTGQVYNRSDWEDFVEYALYNNHHSLLNGDTTIQVSVPKNIQQEVRCWVVKGKIITSSYYRLGQMFYIAECTDEYILDYAQKMVDIYQPADSFVIDIGLVEGEPKIVEINCINCSGFYKLDITKLINSLLTYEISL